MIEYMKSKLTEAPKQNSTTDNLAVAEEANVDESVTAEAKASNEVEIDLKETQKTQAYKNNEHWYWKYYHIWKEKQSIYNSMKENIQSYRIRVLK